MEPAAFREGVEENGPDAVPFGQEGMVDDVAMILASNSRSPNEDLRIGLKNLPWKSKLSVRSWRIDTENEYLPEALVEVDPKDPVLKLRLPAGTVVLVQLQP